MSYEKTIWLDRVVERPRTFTVTNNADGSITLTPAPGAVVQEGTAVNASYMNKIEGALAELFLSGMQLLEGSQVTLNYTEGNLTRADERVNDTLRRETTLNYTGEDLTSVVTKIFDTDGVTIMRQFTDTLTYTDGDLSTVTRVVNV